MQLGVLGMLMAQQALRPTEFNGQGHSQRLALLLRAARMGPCALVLVYSHVGVGPDFPAGLECAPPLLTAPPSSGKVAAGTDFEGT